MKLYICENFKTAKWNKNISDDTKDKKLSLVFAKKCICDFINEKESDIKIIFSKNEYGKPFAQDIYIIKAKNKDDSEKTKTDISIFFSISHSENMMVCAVACFNIGVDCQKQNMENMDQCKKIAKRFYTDEENIFLDSVLSDRQKYINIFFKIWTKKEAYIKYTGKGLAEGLKTFSVTNNTRQKSYCGDVYFKRIYPANLNKTNKTDPNKFYIYLCYNKANKNIWQIKHFN